VLELKKVAVGPAHAPLQNLMQLKERDSGRHLDRIGARSAAWRRAA
jgi:hypothetical protein